MEKKLIRVQRSLFQMKKEDFEKLEDGDKRHIMLEPAMGVANMIGLAGGVIESWQVMVGEKEDSDMVTLILLSDVVSDEEFTNRLDSLEILRFDQTENLDQFVDKLLGVQDETSQPE